MLEQRVFLDENFYLDLVRIMLVKKGFYISLSPTEFLILRCLSERLDHPVSADVIIGTVWGYAIQPRELHVYVTRLRKKIESQKEQSRYLLTVRGYGYLLHSQLNEINDS